MTDTASAPRGAHWHARVFALTWPVLLANVTTPLVGAVDTAVIGRLPDPAYIGAVAVGATIFNAVYWLFGFLRMGTTGLAAQAYGARDPAELVAVAVRALVIALLLGIALVLLRVPLADFVLWLFSASDQVERLAGDYVTIRILGAPALLMHFVVMGALFGLQRMGSALAVSILLNLSNVVLDVLFVMVLGWGVEGVAAGTAISEWLAVSAGLAMLARRLRQAGGRRPSRASLARRDRLFALTGLSVNLIIRTFFVQLPFFLFTLLAAGLGTTVLAANAVLMQLFFVMSYGLDALAHTAETLAGSAYGARDRTRLRTVTGYTLFWSVIVAAGVSIAYGVWGGALIDTLTTLPEVRGTAREFLPWLAAAPLAAVAAFHLDGVFIGTTRIRVLRNSMIVACLCYLLTIHLALDSLGNHGLWLGMIVFMLVRSVLLGLAYPALERSIRS